MNVQDYYNILGVGRNATQLDIENAYEYFKTLHASGQIDVQRWQMIEEAYEVLASVENRMLYDEVLKQDPTPIQSFSASPVPLIDQSSAQTPEANTTNSVVVSVGVAVVLFLATLGIVIAAVGGEESGAVQDSVDDIDTLNVTSQNADIIQMQHCQVTNISENPVAIYDNMVEDSNLDIFLMPSQPIEVYRESSEAEWYLIAPDQTIEPGITITGTADEMDLIGDYLHAEDVQLDFCTDEENN